MNENNIDDQPEVTIISIISKQDYYSAVRDIRSFKISKNTRRRKIILAIMYLIVFNWYLPRYISLPISIGLSVIFTLAVVILTECGNYAYYRYWAYKEYKNNKLLQEKSISEIYKNKYTEKSESAEIILKFEDLYKFVETKDNFMLYESPNLARCITKRMFNNEEDLNKARECFKNINNQKESENKSL